MLHASLPDPRPSGIRASSLHSIDIQRGSDNSRGGPRTGLPVQAVDLSLFQALRGPRVELAREQNVPAFVILHDSTLRNIAAQRPTSVEALDEAGDSGGSTLARYGQRLVEITREQG